MKEELNGICRLLVSGMLITYIGMRVYDKHTNGTSLHPVNTNARYANPSKLEFVVKGVYNNTKNKQSILEDKDIGKTYFVMRDNEGDITLKEFYVEKKVKLKEQKTK